MIFPLLLMAYIWEILRLYNAYIKEGQRKTNETPHYIKTVKGLSPYTFRPWDQYRSFKRRGKRGV